MTHKTLVHLKYEDGFDEEPTMVVLNNEIMDLLAYEVEMADIPEHMVGGLKSLGEGYYWVYYNQETESDDGWESPHTYAIVGDFDIKPCNLGWLYSKIFYIKEWFWLILEKLKSLPKKHWQYDCTYGAIGYSRKGYLWQVMCGKERHNGDGQGTHNKYKVLLLWVLKMEVVKDGSLRHQCW